MRITKFRFWDGENMSFPFDVGDIIGGHADYEEGKSVVMQFTGLTDKSGNEIYEGDIVKQVMYDTYKSWYKAEVIFNRGSFCLNTGTIPETLIPELCEIIGNIYSNPELLTPLDTK